MQNKKSFINQFSKHLSIESFIKIRIYTFQTFLVWELFLEPEKCLLLIDSSCEDFFKDEKFSKLAIARPHKDISVIYLKHNLEQMTDDFVAITSSQKQINFTGPQLNSTYHMKILSDSNQETIWSFVDWFISKNLRCP